MIVPWLLFATSIGVIIGGAFLNVRLEQDLHRRYDGLRPADRNRLVDWMQVDSIVHYVSLWLDRGQALGLLAPPLVGVITTEGVARFASGAALVVAVVALVMVLLPKHPFTYGDKVGKSGLTEVMAVALVVNALGLLAALINQ